MLAALFVLLLPGCRNLLGPQDTAYAETGTFSLAISGGGVGRTILPEISIDDFVRFDIDFVPGTGCNAGNVARETVSWNDAYGMLELPVGIWDIHVTALLAGGMGGAPVETAEGSLMGIGVPPRGSVAGNIALGPIAGG